MPPQSPAAPFPPRIRTPNSPPPALCLSHSSARHLHPQAYATREIQYSSILPGLAEPFLQETSRSFKPQISRFGKIQTVASPAQSRCLNYSLAGRPFQMYPMTASSWHVLFHRVVIAKAIFRFQNFHFPPRADKAGIQPASSLIIYDCAGRSKHAGSGWRGATFVMPSAPPSVHRVGRSYNWQYSRFWICLSWFESRPPSQFFRRRFVCLYPPQSSTTQITRSRSIALRIAAS